MRSPSTVLYIISLSLALSSHAQLLASLPQCIRSCIDQSQYNNCEVNDIACLCRASAGNFLPDLVTCVRANCDMDARVLLDPLQTLCLFAGAPIPPKALSNAQEPPADEPTTLVTMTVTRPASSSADSVTSERLAPQISTVTQTEAMHGSTVEVTYPVTVWRTSTVSPSGPVSTSVSGGLSSGTQSSIPSTSSHGDQPTPSSAIETTYISSTTVAGAQTSSTASRGPSKSPFPESSDDANSAPFKNTNSGTTVNSGTRQYAGGLLGFSVVLLIWMA